uniref:Uncharacterized protein n=1 Tax=Rhizophagus irregularis (strain DAOM 181602 / DAOM 197198 / MUCL 43194) TaxID=747089 RepID=U9UGS0_RHIID
MITFHEIVHSNRKFQFEIEILYIGKCNMYLSWEKTLALTCQTTEKLNSNLSHLVSVTSL